MMRVGCCLHCTGEASLVLNEMVVIGLALDPSKLRHVSTVMVDTVVNGVGVFENVLNN